MSRYHPHTSGKLVMRLWEKSKSRLDENELQWFANSVDMVSGELENLSQNLTQMACLVGSDRDTGSFQSKQSVSNLLFSLAHQLDTLQAVLKVSEMANAYLQNPEIYMSGANQSTSSPDKSDKGAA